MVVRPSPKREAWQSEDDHARTQVGGTVLAAATSTTTGWRPTCEHDGEPVPSTIFDPFMGSGTVALSPAGWAANPSG
jgi:23S rRNA G2445 N2-methylase RlmL